MLRVTLPNRIDQFANVAFSPDSQSLLTVDWDGKAELLDAQSGTLLRVLPNEDVGTVRRVAFSSDGKSLFTVGWSGKVKIWDAQSGTLLHTQQGPTMPVWTAAFSPDGKTVLTNSSFG